MPTIAAGASASFTLTAGQTATFPASGNGIAVLSGGQQDGTPYPIGRSVTTIGPFTSPQNVSVSCDRAVSYTVVPGDLEAAQFDASTGTLYDARGNQISSSGGGGALAPYSGRVTTRNFTCNLFSAAVTQTVSSRIMRMCEAIAGTVTMEFPHWYVNGSGNTTPDWTEKAPGAACSIQAFIEYPVGSGTIVAQVLFGGAPTGTIPDGSYLAGTFDNALAKIPKGANFTVRCWRSCASGLPYLSNASSVVSGEGWVNGGGATQALASGGGAITAATTFTYGPEDTYATTTLESDIVLGDSIALGVSPDYADGYGDGGPYARAMARSGNGYAKATTGGDRLTNFLASRTNRNRLINRSTRIFLALGTNDIIVAPQRTVANLVTDLGTFRTAFAGRRIYFSLIGPLQTTSTDFFTTEANQTVNAGNNATRNAINQAMLTGRISGFDGVIDARPYQETAPASGKWKVGSRGRTVADCTSTNGSNVLTSPTAAFTADDDYRSARVIGAGSSGGNLTAVMRYVNATTVNMTSDGTTALNASTSLAGNGTLHIDAGAYTQDGLHPTQFSNVSAVIGGFMSTVLK